MSSPRATGSISRLYRSFKILGLFLACVVGLSGCPQLLCDISLADQCETYSVTYSANGADSGSLPIDTTEYQEGEVVTVVGNTGGLGRGGYRFTGWNTAADGDGISYSSGSGFYMGAADVTLYTEWSASERDDDEDSGDEEPAPIRFAGTGDTVTEAVISKGDGRLP